MNRNVEVFEVVFVATASAVREHVSFWEDSDLSEFYLVSRFRFELNEWIFKLIVPDFMDESVIIMLHSCVS